MMPLDRVSAHNDPPSVTTSFCVDHSYLPQTSSCGQNFHPLLEEKIPYDRFCLPLIKSHQSYLTDLQHHATVGSLSLKPTELSLV
jgi:hypothetical protein